MGFPDSRIRTYSNGDTLRPGDLARIQDALRAKYNGINKQLIATSYPACACLRRTFQTWDSTYSYSTYTGTGTWHLPIRVSPGAYLDSAYFSHYLPGGTMTYRLFSYGGYGTAPTQLAEAMSSVTGYSTTALSLDTIVEEDKSYRMVLYMPANARVLGLELYQAHRVVMP